MSNPENTAMPCPAWVVPITETDLADQVGRNEGVILRITESIGFDLDIWAKSPNRVPNRYPGLKGVALENMRKSIEAEGVKACVVLDKSTLQVVDGHNRLLCLLDVRKRGIPASFSGFDLRMFQSTAAIADYQDVVGNIVRRLTSRQRQEKIRDAIIRHPDWADGKIALLFGITPETVGNQSRVIESENKVVRPNRRLAANGNWIEVEAIGHSIPEVKKPDAPTENVEDQIIQKLFDAWIGKRGVFVADSKIIADIMVKEDIALPTGEKLQGMNAEAAARKVGAWLKNALAGKVVGGYRLYAFQTAPTKLVYQLIPIKLWIDDIGGPTPESCSEQAE